ncbi:hypothetical protein [Nocardiopsis alba]|uniref:hypothetical protein n=1 Tax=Nocardiopsis alba TaxID=53437 RepID=UPI0033E46DBC
MKPGSNRAPEEKSIDLPSCVLYRDDIQEICSIVSEGADDFNLYVQSGKSWENFRSVDGLADEFFSRRLDSIRISAKVKGSSISVLLGPQSGSIQIENPNSSTKGMARLIKDECEGKKHVLRILLVTFIVSVGAIFAYRLGAAIPVGFLPEPMSGWIGLVSDRTLGEGALSEYVMVVYIAASMIFISKKKYTKTFDIFNWPKGESPLFRDQVKEGWRVSFFWAAVGAMVGFLLGKIF